MFFMYLPGCPNTFSSRRHALVLIPLEQNQREEVVVFRSWSSVSAVRASIFFVKR